MPAVRRGALGGRGPRAAPRARRAAADRAEQGCAERDPHGRGASGAGHWPS
jgi:hypothetical protein